MALQTCNCFADDVRRGGLVKDGMGNLLGAACLVSYTCNMDTIMNVFLSAGLSPEISCAVCYLLRMVVLNKSVCGLARSCRILRWLGGMNELVLLLVMPAERIWRKSWLGKACSPEAKRKT